MVQLLLHCGAEVENRIYPKACEQHDLKDCLFADAKELKCNAVQIPVVHSHQEVAELLIVNGGSFEKWIDCIKLYWGVQTEGDSPRRRKLLHLAVNSPAAGLKMLRLLLDLGADIIEKGHKGRTALHVVAKAGWRKAEGNSRVVKMLLMNGAAVNARDNNDMTPLHYATRTRYRQLEIVEIFLENRADPNATESTSQSIPLQYAADHHDFRILRHLVLSGGDINFKDARARNPKGFGGAGGGGQGVSW